MSILEFIQMVDESTLGYVQEYLRGDMINRVMSTVTHLGDLGIIWIVPTGFMLWRKEYRKQGRELLICFGLTVLINNVFLKNLVDRPRPHETLSALELLIRKPRDFSFPSGHSAAGFAAAFVISKIFGRKLGVPAYVLAASIALSRIGVGAHYPSDVVVGAAVGTTVAAMSWHTMRALERARARKNAEETKDEVVDEADEAVEEQVLSEEETTSDT